MSVSLYKICRNYSMVLGFMLFYQFVFAQAEFKRIIDWQEENTVGLGGRTVLLITKNEEIIFSNAVNELTRKQKIGGKIIARKTGKDAKKITQDFTADTKIAIASCSKWLSAALVMTFIDDGSLQLTDTIGKFFPSFTSKGKGKITIEHCLSHMTGIKPGNLKESRNQIEQASSVAAAVEAIAALPMEALPGEAFHYSNVGLQIAAGVLENISGKPFEKLFAERIANPCSMISSDFGNKPVPLAAGGALSTATDYIHFLQMILNNGSYKGKAVLSKKSVVAMQYDYTINKKKIAAPEEAGDWGYGFGEWIIDKPNNNQRSEVVSSPGLFGSFPYVDYRNNYAAVLITFNLKTKGRHEKYAELKAVIDNSLQNKLQ